MSDKLKNMTIEELVGEAYEIGQAHGGNAFRMALQQPAQRAFEGWWPISQEIERRFQELQTRLVHMSED